jgi:hypothetical protein
MAAGWRGAMWTMRPAEGRRIELEVTMTPLNQQVPSTEQLLDRIRHEFAALPGLRLSAAQAARVWGLDHATAATLLERLVSDEYLVRLADGVMMRSTVVRLLPEFAHRPPQAPREVA